MAHTTSGLYLLYLLYCHFVSKILFPGVKQIPNFTYAHRWWGAKKLPRIISKCKTKYERLVAKVTDAARFNLPFNDGTAAHISSLTVFHPLSLQMSAFAGKILLATMEDMFENQNTKFKVVVMKNRWKRPDWSKMDDEVQEESNGMLDSLVNFEFLDGDFAGYIFEVQFQVHGLLAAKHKEHAVYKIRR